MRKQEDFVEYTLLCICSGVFALILGVSLFLGHTVVCRDTTTLTQSIPIIFLRFWFFFSKNFSVRLVGSDDPMAGRVEIFVNNQWGTLCDDFLDFEVANIICLQLSYTYAMMAYPMAYFGEGTGPTFGFDSCPVNASTIQECTKIEDKKDCYHFEDSGVVCNNARNPKGMWKTKHRNKCLLIMPWSG